MHLYNKASFLRLTLASLVCQIDAKSRYEVLVVDDGSTPEHRRANEDLAVAFNARYVYIGHTGLSVARNRGIQLAEGDIVILIDDDRIVERDFVAGHLQAHEAPDVIVVGARKNTLTFLPGGAPEVWRSWWAKNLMQRVCSSGQANELPKFERISDPCGYTYCDVRDVLEGLDKVRQCSDKSYRRQDVVEHFSTRLEGFLAPWMLFVTGNASVSREALLAVRGFDECFRSWGVDDLELGYRLYQAGMRFRFAPDVLNYHQIHYRPLWTQVRSWIGNHSYFCHKHRCFEVVTSWKFATNHMDAVTYNSFLQQGLDDLSGEALQREEAEWATIVVTPLLILHNRWIGE